MSLSDVPVHVGESHDVDLLLLLQELVGVVEGVLRDVGGVVCHPPVVELHVVDEAGSGEGEMPLFCADVRLLVDPAVLKISRVSVLC